MTKSRHVKVHKSPTKEQLYEDYFVQGLPIETLRLKYGYADQSNIYQRLRKFDMPLRGYGHYQLRRQSLTERQQAIVAGTLFGDGSVPLPTKHHNDLSLRIAHSIKHLEYLEWKVQELRPFIVREHPYKQKLRGFGPRPTMESGTVHHPFFTKMRRAFYPNGTKEITENCLKLLTPLGFAVWLMDDGSYEPSLRYTIISTSSYNLAEHELMREYLGDVWKLPCNIQKSHYGRHYRLYFRPAVTARIRDLVEPHIVPCMSYKVMPAYVAESFPPGSTRRRVVQTVP